jgi:hypothetical protein
MLPQLAALCQAVEHPVLNSRALPAPTDVLSIVIKVVLSAGMVTTEVLCRFSGPAQDASKSPAASSGSIQSTLRLQQKFS